MENETKDDIITSDKIKKDWKRRRRYPPRYIAVSQHKMLIYHWPLPFLLLVPFC